MRPKNHQTLLLSYAIDTNGNLVHIDNVANGKKCGCFCPACKEPLVAKNGGKKKIHHFAHFSDIDCEFAYETMLHLLAKEKIRKAFLEKSKFIIYFEYKSHCNKEKSCEYLIQQEECYLKEKPEFNLKKYYDSCEQELPYDNVKRRSDLKIFSSEFPKRQPIYIEFCVTHPSDTEKLHSGNKIIEIYIENEDDIDNIIKNGFIEDIRQYDDVHYSESLLKQKVQFYGFKNSDYKNKTISQNIEFVRFVLYQSGKMRCYIDSHKCKESPRTYDYSLFEVYFYTEINSEIFEYAKYLAYDRYQILNCVFCENCVRHYINEKLMCRLYKFLKIYQLDTERAKTCTCFKFNESERKKVMSQGLPFPYKILKEKSFSNTE